MKVSVITVTYNSAETLEETIQSVLSQSHPDIEYIIIDNVSSDGTLDVINKYRDKFARVISEKDLSSYDAMNKGIGISTGEIVSILNSDDLYYDKDVLRSVVQEMSQSGADLCWGDLVCVRRRNLSKITRIWRSSQYKKGLFEKGWHPPHPTFFVRKTIYDRYGLFRSDLSLAADYELMFRYLEKYKISSSYIPSFLVKMRDGGRGSWRNARALIKTNFQSYKSWGLNGIKANPLIFILKPLFKLPQLFIK